MSTRDQYLEDAWKQALKYLIDNKQLDQDIVNTFYNDCYIHELNTEKAIIIAPNIIAKQILVPDLIQTALIAVLELDHPINVEVMQDKDLKTRQLIQEAPAQVIDDDDFSSMTIQPDRTFENFVVGDCNRESQAAALACAYNPGKYFNPLFIYGNSGLGKTHLLMAIGNYVKKAYPDKKVYYIESLKFVEKVVKAIQNNKIEYFKQFMCSIDLLLIDDIQFLAGKEKSHEVFFSIYNELVNNRKQVCIENSGSDINDVDEQGLAYIASNFSGNVRDLEGAWNRVLFYAIMFQKDKSIIHFETVVNALRNQAVVSDVTGISPNKIIRCVADYYGLTKQQITGKTRTKNISNARHISIYLCRKLLDLPYIKIGEEFGGRDHATVISACKKVEKQISKDTAFATAVKDIERLLTI